MRRWNICLLALSLFAMPAGVSAQKDPAPSSKKPDIQSRSKPDRGPRENWVALTDLKTGLLPSADVVLQRDEQPDFARELVRIEWRKADPIDLWIARPKGTAKVPAVLYLYSYTDTNDRFHDNGWCKRAVADGFAAVGFVSALTDYRYRARPMREWFVSELQESLGSTVHDVQLLLNYLADRGDMDMDHVGMFGMGSGASIAILAAHVDPRIKALDLLDPWGDWPDWLASSPIVPDTERAKYIAPEFLKSVAPLDPLTYLPSLKTPSFRLQQMVHDPATPEIAKQRIAAAVPDQAYIVKYQSPEDLLKAWQTSGLSGWIKQQIRRQESKEVAMTAQ